MAESTLDQVQRLVAQLSPHEQVRLLASLTLRMAQAVTATSYPTSSTLPETAAAWRSSSVLAMPSPPVIRQRQKP